MIEQIIIHNFQAHRKLILPIKPTVTVIRGPTDAGKSSIVRALRWLMFNRPGGNRFITYGQKSCSVSILLDDHKIERKKKPGLNGYVMDGEPFKAVGTKVPDRIAQVLNVGSINIQAQRDQPLWVSLSPTQASKELNRIINLELIDSSLAYINTETRKRSVLIDGTKERLSQAKKERDSLAWILEADKDLRRIERMESQVSRERGRLTAVERLLTRWEIIQTELAGTAGRSTAAAAILEIATKIKKLREKQARLHSLVCRIEKLESDLDCEKSQLSKLETQLRKVQKCPTCQRPLFTS